MLENLAPQGNAVHVLQPLAARHDAMIEMQAHLQCTMREVVRGNHDTRKEGAAMERKHPHRTLPEHRPPRHRSSVLAASIQIALANREHQASAEWKHSAMLCRRSTDSSRLPQVMGAIHCPPYRDIRRASSVGYAHVLVSLIPSEGFQGGWGFPRIRFFLSTKMVLRKEKP